MKKFHKIKRMMPYIIFIIVIGIIVIGFGITFPGRQLKSECTEDIKETVIYNKYKHWNFLTEGTVVEVEYIAKPTTFGPDIKETILKFDDDRVYVIHNALASVVLNKRIRIYQFNYHVSYEVIE